MPHIMSFAAPVPTANREAYTAFATKMAAYFKREGAEQIMECWGSGVPDGETTSYPKAVQLQDDETVVFGFIKWADKETADAAFAKMRDDPEMQGMGRPPFDGKRLIFGAFEPIVEA